MGGNAYLCLVVIPECWFIVLYEVSIMDRLIQREWNYTAPSVCNAYERILLGAATWSQGLAERKDEVPTCWGDVKECPWMFVHLISVTVESAT